MFSILARPEESSIYWKEAVIGIDSEMMIGFVSAWTKFQAEKTKIAKMKRMLETNIKIGVVKN